MFKPIKEIGTFRVGTIDNDSSIFRVQSWERVAQIYTDMPQTFGSLELAVQFCRDESAKLKQRYQLSGMVQEAKPEYDQVERELTNEDMDAICGAGHQYSDDYPGAREEWY